MIYGLTIKLKNSEIMALHNLNAKTKKTANHIKSIKAGKYLLGSDSTESILCRNRGSAFCNLGATVLKRVWGTTRRF